MMLKCLLFATLVTLSFAQCGCVNQGPAIPGVVASGGCIQEAGTCDNLNAFAPAGNTFVCQGTTCPAGPAQTTCTCEDQNGNTVTGVAPGFCFPFDFTRTACPGATSAPNTQAPSDTCCCLPAGAAPTDACLPNTATDVCAATGNACEQTCDCVPVGDDPVTGSFLPGVRVALCTSGGGFCRTAPATTAAPAPGTTAAPAPGTTAAPVPATTAAPAPTCCCFAQGADTSNPNACTVLDQAFCLKGRGTCQQDVEPTCCCEFAGSTGPCLANFPTASCQASGKTCRNAAPAPAECCCFPFGSGAGDACRPGIPSQVCTKGGGTCDIERCCCEIGEDQCQPNFPRANCELSGFSCQTAPTPVPPTAAPVAVCLCQPNTGGPAVPDVPVEVCNKGDGVCEATCDCQPSDGTAVEPNVPVSVCSKGSGTCVGATTTAAPPATTEATEPATTQAPVSDTCACLTADGVTIINNTPRHVCIKGNGQCPPYSNVQPPAATTQAPAPGTTQAPAPGTTQATTAGPTGTKTIGEPGTKPAGSSCTASNECITGCCRFQIATETLQCSEAGGTQLCI